MFSSSMSFYFFFFFNDTATTEIYTLSLHDALPIFGRDVYVACAGRSVSRDTDGRRRQEASCEPRRWRPGGDSRRSEEHTSELQSRLHLVCRLLLEKKKKIQLKILDRATLIVKVRVM